MTCVDIACNGCCGNNLRNLSDQPPRNADQRSFIFHQKSIMVYGEHLVVSPLKRWGILALYWVVLAMFVVPRDKLQELLDTEWQPISLLHVVHLIISTSIFFSVWTYSAYTFERSFSWFSAIVYPMGQVLDSTAWLCLVDIGRTFGGSSMIGQYLGGILLLCPCIAIHRRTMELSYLPEHHPPLDVRGNLLYVPVAIASGLLFAAIYHWHGDVRWCVLIRYIQDLYFCTRMRLPGPWEPYANEHEKNKGWDWKGF